MSREDQGKVKAKPKQGQGELKVRSRYGQGNASTTSTNNLMGFDTIEINLVHNCSQLL